MLVRVLPALVAVVVAVGLAGCAGQTPDTTDVDRIAVMRAESIFAHLVGDADAAQGREAAGAFVANTYDAPVDPWAGENMPVGPTVSQRKGAVADLVVQLRASGWSIISARCDGGDADDVATDATPDATTDAVVDAPVAAAYQWEVFGYRIRDGVPYAVHLVATFTDTAGLSVRVSMATPFHGDAATYFANVPPPLADGATCVESAEEQPGPASQGTIWSLDAARG